MHLLCQTSSNLDMFFFPISSQINRFKYFFIWFDFSSLVQPISAILEGVHSLHHNHFPYPRQGVQNLDAKYSSFQNHRICIIRFYANK